LAQAQTLSVWDPSTGDVQTWADGFTEVRSISLATEAKCESAIVLDGDRVVRVWADHRETLAEGLTDARNAVTDGDGRLYALAGSPLSLQRFDDGRWVTIVRRLPAARDLHFGFGGAFPRANLYIADADGTLDYLRPPPTDQTLGSD
jgi:hypothetical protein